MIKYTKTETIGEMQASESVEFETFDQLLDYLRKDKTTDCIEKTGDSHKQKDLLDDEVKPAKVINDIAC